MMAAASSSSRKCEGIMMMMLFFFSTFFSSISGESMLARDRHGDHEPQQLKKQMKMMLGSSPPRCVNRCLSCRPCTATLVTPPHHKMNNLKATPHHYEGDENYYLLGWKCRCRNKLFQP